MIRAVALLFLILPPLWAEKLTLRGLFLENVYLTHPEEIYQWHQEKDFLYKLSKDQLWYIDPATGQKKLVWEEEGLKDYLPGPSGVLLEIKGKFYYLPDKEEVLLPLPEGEDHAFSPTGNKIAYVRDYNLFLYDLVKKKEKALTNGGTESFRYGKSDWVNCEELDLCKGFWWSRDGKGIAFLNLSEGGVQTYPLLFHKEGKVRIKEIFYPKAGNINPIIRLGVASLEKENLEMVPLGEAYIPRIAWDQDGHLWVLTLNRWQNHLTLWRYDPSSQELVALYNETSPTWINIKGDLYPLKDGSCLFISERSGYAHLWKVSPQKKLKPITQGKWEITRFYGVDREEKFGYFQATLPSSLERHLHKVDLDTGKTTLLTHTSGWHRASFSPSLRFCLHTYSNEYTPSTTTLWDLKAEKETPLYTTRGEKWEDLTIGTLRFVEVPSPQGNLQGMLFLPRKFNPKKRYPVLIYVYGGPHAQVVGRYFRSTWLFFHYLAQEGILVFALDNRGSAGKGKAWEDWLLGALGRHELEDQLKGLDWLTSQRFVDPKRIAIFGWSYGGFMTLYALTHSDRFKAGVAVAPVTDWRFYDTIYTERYLKLPQKNLEGYDASSILQAAKNLKGDLLLIHGSADDNVHPQHSWELIQRLVEEGIPFQQAWFPNKDHGIRGKQTRYYLFSMVAKFLKKELKDGK